MFIDTSAIVAILADEPEADALLAVIDNNRRRETGVHVRIETTIALARALGLPVPVAEALVDAFLTTAAITVLSINDAVARRAVTAFTRFGVGQDNPAQLNFADCLSYALAAYYRAPILHNGGGLGKTDLDPAQ